MKGADAKAIGKRAEARWDPQTTVALGLVLLILAPFQPFIPSVLLEESDFTIWWLILGGLIGTPTMILAAFWAFASALLTRNRPRSR